jgi:hypothetical protein
MAQEIINTGALPNDGEGDPLRVAFTKINNNFSELFSESSSEGSNGAIQYNLVTVGYGATAHSVITGGVVTDIVIDLVGSGYKSLNPPSVSITPASGDTTGSGATAIAEVTDDYVSSILITNGGNSYTLPPIVTLSQTFDNELKGSEDLVYNLEEHSITMGANLLVFTNNTYQIGDTHNRIKQIFLNQAGATIGNVSVSETGNTLYFQVSANTQVKSDIVVSNITAQNITAASINSGNVSVSDKVTITIDNDPNQSILEIPVSDFSYGKFMVSSRQANSQFYQSATVDGTKSSDGSSVKYMVYGTIFNGTVVNSYDMDIFNGNVRLLVSPQPNEVVTHKVSYQITK